MPAYTSVMEKGHFGNEAGKSDHGSEDVNSASSSFPLDFAGMLDAADSVLHQQIYEYLQGPGVQRQHQLDHNHQFLASSLDQGLPGTFPGSSTTQRLYPPSGTAFPSALSTFPEEPLRGFVDSNTHLRRPASIEYRRKDKGIGTSAGMEMQMGMGALPAQMTFSDVFQAPVQPHLVFNSNTREFSAHETSCSPNGHLKRPGSSNELPDILSPHEPRSRPGRKAQKIEPVQDLKLQRPTEQAEHIIRERQRRDDMTSKFLMLESLLPPGPKRDRSTIVEDSIQYVKSLHHRVKELHEKRSKLKSHAISTTAKKATALGLNSDKNHVVAPASIREGTITAKNPALAASPSESRHALSGRIEKIEVHMDLPHQIVIEMTCRPHRHIQSQIMAALERLGLEVLRCSISKLHNRLICVLVVKPRDMTGPQITGNDVIGALNHAVVPDQESRSI